MLGSRLNRISRFTYQYGGMNSNAGMISPSLYQVRNLNLQECDSKQLMNNFDVTVQRFKLATSPDEALSKSNELIKETNCDELVVKAMILAGGRGKGTFVENGFKGGVHLTKDVNKVAELASKMLGYHLVTKQTPAKGVKVQKLMIAESIRITRELYVAILMDRGSMGPVVVASTEGGMDIEEVAEKTPEKIFKVPVNIDLGLQESQAEDLARKLGFSELHRVRDAAEQILRLYDLFIASDATQVEINPFADTTADRVYCVDAKINFDDNAKFRQKEVFAMHDTSEDDPREVAAEEAGLNYVGLDGNIGCLVNGAGLAMATLDIIQAHGGFPSNFLDAGGGSSEAQIKKAFSIIMSDSQVEAILVNIFGGIVRCDVIASGIIKAAKETGLKVPLVVRLAGTNHEEGSKMLEESGIKIITATDLDDAAKKAVAAVKKN